MARLTEALDSAGKAADGGDDRRCRPAGPDRAGAGAGRQGQRAGCRGAGGLGDKVLDSADALIGTEAARDLPPALAAALDQVRALVADLRDKNTARS